MEHRIDHGALEGHQVDVTLHDGCTIAACQLVSGGRRLVPTLWLVVDGGDLFLPMDTVLALAATPRRTGDAAA